MDEYEKLSKQVGGAALELQDFLGFSDPFERFMKEVEQLAEGGSSMTLVARRYKAALSRRRDLLINTGARTDAFDRLIPLIKDSGQTLVFGERIAQATDLATTLTRNDISAAAINSDLDGDDRKMLLRDFARGAIKVVAAPKVLDQGVDVPEADLAVVVATTRSRRQMIQRMGRVVRRKADGREARFVMIFVRGTTEDPANGAHDLFLKEVEQAATAVQTFPLDWDGQQVIDWFNAPVDKPASPAATRNESKPNARDKTVAKHSGMTPERVRELRVLYPPARNSTKVVPATRQLAGSLGIELDVLARWTAAEQKARGVADTTPSAEQQGDEPSNRRRDQRVASVSDYLSEAEVRSLRLRLPDVRPASKRPIASEALARRLSVPFHVLVDWFKAEETIDKVPLKPVRATELPQRNEPGGKRASPATRKSFASAAKRFKEQQASINGLVETFRESHPSAPKNEAKRLRRRLPALLDRYDETAIRDQTSRDSTVARIEAALAKRTDRRSSQPEDRKSIPKRQSRRTTEVGGTNRERRPTTVQPTGPGLTPSGVVHRCKSCGQSITLANQCGCS